MQTRTVSYGEFELAVIPERNECGAWIASVKVSRGDQTVLNARPATVQPEWSTEDEAIRDGVEWGRRFVDREFNSQPAHSWVATRTRAERWWIRDTEESALQQDQRTHNVDTGTR